MQAPNSILVEIRQDVAIITFNRPQARNALSIDVLDGLDEIISELTDRSDINRLIFTGRENVFLSGADIRQLRSLDPEAASIFGERGQRLFHRIAAARQKTVAAINGFCMGGGLDFALACDIRVAAPNAEFAHPGARLGIITGWGGTQRLPRLIGRPRAIEFFITARRLSAREAFNIGLVDAVDASPLQYSLQISL
ncbi:MAG TPA: enoyl-CoA hydratase/isomerase family protein [Pyrinomonadaceae bacterium]